MSELLFLYSNCGKIVYRVSEDENLFDICKKFNQTPVKIIADNCLEGAPKANSLIYVERGSQRIYTVKVGDTLEKIAKASKMSVDELLEVNGIQYIFPYQMLKLD